MPIYSVMYSYSVIRPVVKALGALGWVLVVAGALYTIVAGVVEPNLSGHSFGPTDLLDILIGALSSILGLGLVAYGELIGVFLAIEENTRRGADGIETLVKRSAPQAVK